MNKVTMNVQQALGKVKLLDKKFIKELSETDFVCAVKGSGKDAKIAGVTLDDWQNNQKANYDSLVDISNEIDAIKRALNQSNAQTKVKIGGKEYTVAEAIYMKQSGISYKKELVKQMKAKFDRVNAFVINQNDKAMVDSENFVSKIYGGEKAPAGVDDLASVMNSYYSVREHKLVDPISILDKIKKLEKEIDDFETEVDNVLSVSNATTLIEVEF